MPIFKISHMRSPLFCWGFLILGIDYTEFPYIDIYFSVVWLVRGWCERLTVFANITCDLVFSGLYHQRTPNFCWPKPTKMCKRVGYVRIITVFTENLICGKKNMDYFLSQLSQSCLWFSVFCVHKLQVHQPCGLLPMRQKALCSTPHKL